MPGVSTRMTCDLPISAMPRTGPRVVCALWVTIETLAPTSALVSVDLPLFGAPISATKPQRVFSSPVALPAGLLLRSRPALALAIMRGPPDPFAQQHGECCRLLRGALIGALTALGCHAVDLHFGSEARRMVWPLAGDLEITRERQAPSLRPFLQHGFRVGRSRLELAQMRFPEAAHYNAGGIEAGIGEDRPEHGLAGIGEDRLLAAPTAQSLAAAHQDEIAKPPGLGYLGAGFGADQMIEPAGKLALVCVRKLVGEKLGNGEAEHAVAEELEAFIVLVRLAARARAGVGERELQQRGIGKFVSEHGGQFANGLMPPFRQAQRTTWKMRAQRTLSGQSHTCQKLASSLIEKKMICALPTRFSNGTKPTSDRKRLSVELSRLSPIMKKCPSGTL